MPITNGYVTLEQMVERLSLPDSRDRTVIEAKITQASRLIDTWCGRIFYDSGAATARVFNATSAYSLRVGDFSTTTGLVVKTDTVDDATYATTWASTDYEVLPLSGGNYTNQPYYELRAVGNYLFLPGNKRLGNAQITARWGWSAVPSEVEAACEILTQDLWARRNANFGIAQSGVDFGGLRIPRDVFIQIASHITHLRRVERTFGFA